jgi:translocator protein
MSFPSVAGRGAKDCFAYRGTRHSRMPGTRGVARVSHHATAQCRTVPIDTPVQTKLRKEMTATKIDHTPKTVPVSKVVAAAISSCAFVVPLALSVSSTPSPNHPRTMLWYLSLREPAFKPPDWLFPIAWTAIEAALARASYRLLRAPPSPARTKSLALWGWNVFMIGGWSRLFFKRHQLAVSTVAAASLVATSVSFVSEAKKVDAAASRAGLPLVGWVAFATVLTATIWHLNRKR